MALKIVNFDEYCSTCIHRDKTEKDDPCWYCLAEPINEDSHKPVNYEEKTK